MSKNDLSDDEQAVLRAAESVEDAVDVLGDYAAAEQPTIVEQDALEAKNEQLEEFADVFRDALQNEKGLKESTVNAMGIDALASEFRGEDGEISTTTLSQTPETSLGGSGGSENSDASFDSLSLSERDEVKEKVNKIELLKGRVGDDYLDALKSDAAELAKVDEYEDIELGAL